MPGKRPLIVRIVVDGSPPPNFVEVRKMLLRAFGDTIWRGKASFALTPGGFIQAPFPENYHGGHGWDSRPGDFRKLVPHAHKVLKRILTAEVLSAARDRADFLTLGIDLNRDKGKHKMDRLPRGIHAELVAVVETASGEVMRWTGKSYSLGWQEKTLVHETDLGSHLLRCGKERVLVLGCHDLNMFSNRSYANQKPDGPRRERCNRMRQLAREFRPTVILDHPHSTDSPRIWSTAWGGLLQLLSRQGDRKAVSYASGIGYYNDLENPRRELRDVLAGTSCGGNHLLDVVVKGS